MPTQIYQDKAGEWRYRIVGGNNEKMASSTEGYITEQDAHRGYDDLVSLIVSDADAGKRPVKADD